MTQTFPLTLPILTSSSFLATHLLLALLLHVTSSENPYSIKTSEVFHPTPFGFPAALWDTNHDRLTDVIVWEKGSDGDIIRIFESLTDLQRKHPVLQQSTTTVTLPKDRSIVSAIPGDFDGDMVLDLVIVTTPATPTPDSYRLYVSWGKGNPSSNQWILMDPPAEILGSDGAAIDLLRQPTVLDFDGNTVPDLLMQLKNDSSIKRLFVGNLGSQPPRKWEMAEWTELTTLSFLLTPHSNAFIDINGDLMADLCLAMKDKDGNHYLVIALHDEFVKEEIPNDMPFKELVTIGLNSTNVGEIKGIGQISFLDFNNDQRIDALIPVQNATGGTNLWIFDWATNSFKDVTPDWEGYQLLEANDQTGVPQRIHMGDFNQDGYTDGVAIVKKGKTERKVVLLKNEPVSLAPDASDEDRMFVLDAKKTETMASADGSLEMASFFDAYDDGFLDILVMSSNGEERKKIDCYQNDLGIDATWIKAMVYTGFCGNLPGFPPCPKETNNLALSLPVVGASVKMNTTRGDGKQQAVAAGLLTQLTHFSLQMPTTIFGLGRSPNFVDKIAVGLSPVLNHTSGIEHSKVFEQTIPNSAVVINPNPLNQPNNWRAFIYVTPSSAMLETGIVLSVVFALLAILVGLLHLKEKREDQKEKLVEMQRFHFDAM